MLTVKLKKSSLPGSDGYHIVFCKKKIDSKVKKKSFVPDSDGINWLPQSTKYKVKHDSGVAAHCCAIFFNYLGGEIWISSSC